MFLPQSGRPSFVPIQYNWQNHSFVYSDQFFILNWRINDSEMNDSKHSLNLIYSWLHHERQSDLLVSSPSTWILPHFQTIH
jgi:hypothetical protein